MRSTAVVAFILSLSPLAFAAKDYENFDLPKTSTSVPGSEAPTGGMYTSSRVQLKSKVQTRASGFNAQKYVFAREAYLAEKRDEAIKLLRQELDSGLKRNRDNLLLRLGQLYSEKYMELSHRENEVFTKSLADYEAAKAAKKKVEAPKLDNSRSAHYLKEALGLFTSLEKEFPRHPKIDEVVFFIGFVEMEYGKTEKGMKYLERVVREFPRSRKFEEAVVFLGDHYFEKTKFNDAVAKYRILTLRKDSPLYHYGRYKLAWCDLNLNRPKKGLDAMKDIISELKGNQEVAKFNLRDQAIKDLVVFYGETGEVDEAIDYFTDVAGRDKAMVNLKLIADILRSKAQDDAAVKAYQKLLAEFPNSPEAPRMAVGIHDSQVRLGRPNEAVKTLTQAMDTYGESSGWAKKLPEAQRAEGQSSVTFLGDEAQKAAFFYHSSAQKSANKKNSQLALQLYTSILEYYPNHPEKKKIAFYRGEIFYAEAKWLEAADSYMVAAKSAPKDKVADEATYNALLALDRMTAKNDNLQRFSKEEQKTVDMTQQDIPTPERRFIEVAEFYLKEYPQGTRVVDVRFRIAAIYYRYHHFDKAQVGFKEIALKHPTHKSATTSAHIVLDIYNLNKQYVQLDTTAAEFAAQKNLGDAKFKAEMAQIGGELSFKKIETLEASNKWKEAGDAYFTFYKKDASGPLAEKALYNAFVSYDKANENALASETSRLFVAKYPTSEYTKRFILNLAKLAEKQYDFEQAQKLYQDFHKKFPTDKEARKALYNAAVFAELFEWNKQALDLYATYLKEGKVDAEEARSIAISQAKLYRKDGQWDKMAQTYRRLIRETKGVEGQLVLLGEMARQYERAGKMKERTDILNELRVTYENSKAKSAGTAAGFIAEAKFKQLTKSRETYEKIALRFPVEDFLYLMNRKQKLLAKLATAYDTVVDVGVPEWGVAALYEKGEAFENFVRGFNAVKIPNSYKDADRAEVEKQLALLKDKLVTPLEAKSQDFFKDCAAKASQFYVDSQYAQKCVAKVKPKTGDVAQSGEPNGVFPKPSYWTTRWTGGGIVKR